MSTTLPPPIAPSPADAPLPIVHGCAPSHVRLTARENTSPASLIRTSAVASAVLAQGVMLARLDGPSITILLVTAVLALACTAAWTQRTRVRHADVLIATLAFGGLGMMAGEWIARAVAPTSGHSDWHPHGAMHVAPSAASWLVATGVMLLTCAAACRWTCAPLCHGGRARRLIAHIIAAAGMAGGMAAMGALLAPMLAAPLGAAAGMHLAMVLGMAIGISASMPIVAWVDARSAGGGGKLSGAEPAG